MMRERKKGRTQEQAAASANVRSCQTVAKYEQLGEPPSERVAPRQYRTRTDVFAEDWETLAARTGSKRLADGAAALLTARRSDSSFRSGQSVYQCGLCELVKELGYSRQYEQYR